MRNAGYDHMVFEGKADKPIYVLVSDEKVEFREAEHIWGRDSHETEDIIRNETEDSGKKVRIACIGPAGEKLVRIAAVMNDKHRAAARCGIGAVMGSKNLKAVAVRGSRKAEIADDTALKGLSKEAVNKIKSKPEMETLSQFGTAGVVTLINAMGILPTRNFQRTAFEKAMNISGEFLAEKFLQKNKACFGCPVGCGRGAAVKESGYEGEGEGPEYETIAMLGSSLENGKLADVTKANYLCNRLGIDTISAGGTIACAMEMFEKGYISKHDTGMELRFGDEKLVVELIDLIGKREGFGDALAEGGFPLAQKYGHPECFMGVNKMEIPGYEPRGAKGMGITYMTSKRFRT